MRLSRRAALASTAGAALALAQSTKTSLPMTPHLSDAVSEWIHRAAIPLSTPVAGHGFDDMEPLRKIVGDARIVALGEATHGTREFSQLKHRMLEFLVTQMGFSIFSIEGSMPESYRLNDFVLKGEGNPAQLLKGPLTLWDTQEVLDMVLWMREYNRSGKGRVEFTGFDMQDPRAAIEIVSRLRGEGRCGVHAHFGARFGNGACAEPEVGGSDNCYRVGESRNAFGVSASTRGN